ncbi:hypothetical protein VIGAN_02145200 [Vigna angularis var. angularis]|uniref:Uncharacterized protein n=1 Tax=Vigna angularis var. angularis TaxID=157739 RepID=A0A0S3RDT3_PHAAN|nr:hypothetical protein VIGAN_02145200 [Vigna angularis var. angularis]
MPRGVVCLHEWRSRTETFVPKLAIPYHCIYILCIGMGLTGILRRALCCRRGEGGGGEAVQGSPRRRNPQWDSGGGHAELVEADVGASRCED